MFSGRDINILLRTAETLIPLVLKVEHYCLDVLENLGSSTVKGKDIIEQRFL